MNHKTMIRKVWWISGLIAFLVFAFSSGFIASHLSRGTDISKILMVTTLAFQVVAFPFIIGFTIPSVITIIAKADKTLEIGQKSSESLGQLQSEFVPVLKSLKTGITDLSELVEKVKHGNGELKDTMTKAFQEARAIVKDGESQVETFIYDKIDKFLAGAFAPKGDENGHA